MDRRVIGMALTAGATTLALVAAGAGAATAAPGQERRGTDPAPHDRPVASAPAAQAEVIEGEWIVVFHPGTKDSRGKAARLAKDSGGTVRVVYENALQGYAGKIPKDKVEKVRADADVAFVEPDSVMRATDTQSPATWGLDRTDQRALPLDNSYTDGNEGAGVHAYVIDTGVELGHVEFSGRLGNGFDAVTSGGSADDCNGHGTHVAGTVAGTTYGIADKATVHPVRVLSCTGSGSNSGVIAGVDWVRANHVKPAVANLSLGGGASTALDNAITNLIAAGVTTVVAAGNDNRDACGYSPARVPGAITVGSTTRTDARSSFSNFGTCLDVFGPGSEITSAWHTSTTATNTISGTSMASPHVAGVAALQLAATPAAAPAAVRDALVANATTGKVTSAGTGSPNVLLYSGYLLGGTPTPTPTPTPTTPPPTGGTIVNGGFESGSSPWVQSSAGGYALIDSARPRTGSFGVWGGGYNNANDRIEQTLTVPSSGNALTYWWQLASSESTTRAYDYMRVEVRSTSGTLLSTLRTRSNTSPRGAWASDTLSLASWAGQTVTVRFAFTTDSSVTSSFYVDDVSLG